MHQQVSRLLRSISRCAVLASLVLSGAVGAQTLPTGARAVSGHVTTTKSDDTLTINQASENAIVNWQSFSIGSKNTVNVIQPNSSATLLDRVTGNIPSTIAGRLDANGQVFLINPNGIAITKSGVVNVGGGFVASTLDIADADFKNGKFVFSGNGASAGATNQGAVTVGRGGYAALLGGTVNNAGLVKVPLGKIGLGSGEAATLDVSGDGFLQVAVPTRAGAAGAALIQSAGTLSAAGGSVLVSAASVRAAARNAINLSGLVEANAISGHSGAITLSGGAGGSVEVSGTLDASGASGSGGGDVTITGQNIALSGAAIGVAGGTAGGVVRIGGNLHGAGSLPAADSLSVDAQSVISADSTRSGNGGSVVLWSNQSTVFTGRISALGGANGGDGGSAEVSSRGVLTYAGSTDLTAAHGTLGNLLLDPYSITISNAVTSNGALSGGGFTPSGSGSVLNVTDLHNALTTANVTVSTGGAGSAGGDAGDITVANALTWSSASSLTLSAYHSIAVDAGINISGAGGLTLNTNNGGSGGTLTFANGASVNYGATNNGGTLAINGHAYTLLYKLTDSSTATGNGTDSGTDDIAGIDNNSAAGADSGYYALATSVTGTGSTSAAQFAHPLVGSASHSFAGTFEGLGNTITNLTINDSADVNVGLFGSNTRGVIRDVGLIGGSVTGTRGCCNENGVGGLVGNNGNGGGGVTALVVNDYNTGTVNGGYGAYVGGLVGYNEGYNSNATVQNSYATGAVGGGDDAGGLVGFNLGNNGTGSIINSYATGAVSSGYWVGGLLGFNDAYGGNAVVSNVYSTGAISGASYPSGGVIAYTAGTISHAYWDSGTTGTSNGSGVPNGSGPTISVTTAQLQSTATSGITLGSAFAGGAAGGTNGVYPYLVSFFPNGVQAISGTAYKDAGVTALASTASGAGLVSVAAGGGALAGTSSTGANGYYYIAVPAGTLAANQGVVAFTQVNSATGALDGSTFVQSGGSTTTSLNVYGGWHVDQPGSLASLSALNSAYATAIATTAAAGLTIANREIDPAAAFAIDQSLSASGTLVIAAGGAVTETGAATLAAANLRLTGNTSSFTLDNANQIGTLAAAVGTLSLIDATDLSTGTIQDAYGNPAVSGVGSAGALTLKSTGNLTLAATAAGVSGAAPILSAGGAFVNNAGASAVIATSGRWLIYSSSPGADTFGGLNSANTAVFNATDSNLPPPNVTQSGNRYLFANQPVLNVTSVSDTKTYGVDSTASVAGDYAISGFPTAVNAFVSDTVGSVTSGTPSVTSSGSTAFTPVTNSPYAINVSTGSLAASSGYTLNFVNSGQLTVNRATITVAGATGVNKTYDSTTALPSGATGFTSSGIFPSDANAVSVNAATAAYAGANAGPQNVNVSGLALSGSAAGDYTLASTSVTGSGTIARALINLNGIRTYDAGVDASAAIFGAGGVIAGVSAETLTLSGTGALAAKNVGNQAVTSLGSLALVSGSGLASNYTLIGGTDAVTVNPATITVGGATGVNKAYDSTTALPSGATGFTANGIFSSDASTLKVSSSSGAYLRPSVGNETVNVSGLTLSGSDAANYVLSSTSVRGSGTISAVVPTLPVTSLVASGVGGFALSGTILNSSTGPNGLPMTVVGSLSNGGTTISGTFIVQARLGIGNSPLGDQIAESNTEVVTYVPGTLAARLPPGDAGIGLASVTARTAANEVGRPIDAMPHVYSISDGTARSWRAIDTFSSPGFDQAVACVKEVCVIAARANDTGK